VLGLPSAGSNDGGDVILLHGIEVSHGGFTHAVTAAGVAVPMLELPRIELAAI